MGFCSSTPPRDNTAPDVNIKIEDHVAHSGATTLRRPLVYGHRGGSKKYPENTIEAFKDALANGADGCELDVFLTKDKYVVCFHDDTTERLLDGPKVKVVDAVWKGDLEDRRHKRTLTYDRETLAFDTAHPISLLEDVFKEFKGKTSNLGLPFVLNVELKPGMPSLFPLWGHKVGKYVANLIREHGMEAQVTVVGFDPKKLRQVESVYPGLHTGWQYDDNFPILGSVLGTANSWSNKTPTKEERQGLFTKFIRGFMESAIVDRLIVGATIVDLEHTVCDDNTVEKFHDKGFAVGCFAFFPTDLSSVLDPPPTDGEGAYERYQLD
ncbi:glycerophosphoryl diester phosphodiesterase, putative [Bodo saltans]|uniref:Glycerophosphoryl diester phosphodiesterase, putative n=1 Tax=Bodo saltans TaxID=75058 RepID=A0A0S4J4V6_BODSA|nr:glycerophosphoryl diester phosphodiesterase, putative [Bodo saltans]|eukprot:CUG86444.1 glycerophosphoryl diester phosphodiesterase, putative [Bodo saltans]